ncbi:Pyrimidine 5-nucleotidase family protein [Zostera marina]|uniref:Pyrimidine 5-nucleotidase family protein n=1 Tax=Zostera marina TaxID=29655 RepID=A0A0K9PJ69_ZOSMR|nr:Pyrimidine 5-nucleotidase family protein [Zostera marina]
MKEYDEVRLPKYDCLLFDLDDTLYPVSFGLQSACSKNITDYMSEKLGIKDGEIPDLSNALYKTYGTTLAGLRAIGYNINYDEYHSFVHGRLPYENLKYDAVLRSLLLSLPYRKVIFTNADRIHAVKVLTLLGLEDCFEGIICFETLNRQQNFNSDATDSSPIFDIVGHFAKLDAEIELPKTPVLCKPSGESILQALQIADVDPDRTIFFEDSVRNIQSGKRIGLHTVLVGTSQRMKGADHSLESIHNLREAFPELWEDAKKLEEILYDGKVAIETSVTA